MPLLRLDLPLAEEFCEFVVQSGCSLLFTSEHSNSVFSGATKVRWADAERLRRYTEAVENSAEAKGEMTQELQAWIDWARLKADCRDPLVPVSDAVLDGPESQAPGYHYW